MSLTALEILRVHQNSLKIQLTESLDWLIRMEMEYSTSQRSSQTSCLFLKGSSSIKDRSLLGHPLIYGSSKILTVTIRLIKRQAGLMEDL